MYHILSRFAAVNKYGFKICYIPLIRDTPPRVLRSTIANIPINKSRKEHMKESKKEYNKKKSVSKNTKHISNEYDEDLAANYRG